MALPISETPDAFDVFHAYGLTMCMAQGFEQALATLVLLFGRDRATRRPESPEALSSAVARSMEAFERAPEPWTCQARCAGANAPRPFPDFLTRRELAELVGVSDDVVDRWKDGLGLDYYRIGPKILFARTAVDEFLARHQVNRYDKRKDPGRPE